MNNAPRCVETERFIYKKIYARTKKPKGRKSAAKILFPTLPLSIYATPSKIVSARPRRRVTRSKQACGLLSSVV